MSSEKQLNQKENHSSTFEKCIFCKRLLSSEDSKKVGYGLTCGMKNNMIKKKEKKEKVIKILKNKVVQKSHNLFDY